MSGHRDWINTQTFTILTFDKDKKCTGSVKVETQSATYTRQQKCAEVTCPVILAWHDAGGDDNGSDQFAAENCQCDEKDYCCKEHRSTFVCYTCAEEEEEKEEDDASKKRDRE